ncbi:MAG: glycine--tRNA ligase subunit beta [Candidatus Hydrogenedentota bacterium]|nr:MAG: glycine--tRNA ligase subunit beta [Candidatus Hydrogenedentota bacterium]
MPSIHFFVFSGYLLLKNADMLKDFLFELYTEEIPASYQKSALQQWKRLLPDLAKKKGLQYQSMDFGGTPRRLYFRINHLDEKTKEEKQEIKGPPKNICFENNQPTKALEGFLKKAGISLEQVEFRNIGKSEYAFAKITIGGEPVETVLPELIETLIFSVSFPKTMRWSNLEIAYARPIIHLYFQFGKDVWTQEKIESCKKLSQLKVSPSITGHFILSKKPFSLADPKGYEEKLKKHHVLVREDDRKQKIEKELHEKAKPYSLSENQRLLDEVTWLTENPSVLVGIFPKEFLRLPDIVILSEMELHQRYFGTLLEGKVTEKFLVVTNGDPAYEKNIITGNERVLKARLSDGAFFYDEDRKKPLIDRVDDLKSIVFLEGFGSMYDKKERLKKIAATITKFSYPFKIADDLIHRACDLAKADLTTALVYEFDHLQGEIGSIYAQEDKEPEEVCKAIYEHYLPRRQGDAYPKTPLGILLSLSEKIDNVFAGFLSGNKPTSSQDPLALRRQTLYWIDIIIEIQWQFALQDFLEGVATRYHNVTQVSSKDIIEIRDFILGRLQTVFEKQGIDKKLIAAGIASEEGKWKLTSLWQKLSALNDFKKDDRFQRILASFKRMAGILKEHKISVAQKMEKPDSNLFETQEEKLLMELAEKLQEKSSFQNAKDYQAFFQILADSKETVDQFFDSVMVNVEDDAIRKNRLALLAYAVHPVQQVLDLSRLL